MNIDENTVAICMATYNGEKYIKEQIESIICQLSPEDEIVVSDDGSTDGTIAIIQSFKDDRIKIVQGPCKSKPALNFENALISVLISFLQPNAASAILIGTSR